MDLVAHCGRHLSGTFLWALSLTDIASGWTECEALPAVITSVRRSCPDKRSTLPSG